MNFIFKNEFTALKTVLLKLGFETENIPLWGEGGLLSRWVRVSCRVFAMKPGGRLGDPWGARVQKTPALAAEM